MRETKFRGKSLRSGKWVYGHYFEQRGRPDMSGRSPRYHMIISIEKPPTQIDPKTLGQYTGLKDKNGRDIYEYDIDNSDGELMYVAFEDGAYGLKYLNPINHNTKRYFDPYINFDELNIIGNIHDNPELLEGAKQ